MTEETKKIALTYEERQALPVIRKLLKRKPEAAAMLIEGITKDAAVGILVHAQHELTQLHHVTKAITQAAGEIAKLGKQENL